MHHSESAQKKEKQNAPTPHSNIRTCVKLCPLSKKSVLSQGSYNYPAPNFQRHPNKPNHLLFHNFHKFNSSQFEFSRVFNEHSSNNLIIEQCDLFEEVIQKNQNVCIFTIGSHTSGIKDVCYGQNGNDGLFFCLMAQLWDRLAALKDHPNEQSFQPRLLLRMVVIANDKMHDLLNPASQATIKEKGQRFILIGCSSYQMSSVYDLLIKFRQVYEHRKLMYPESIMVIEGEIMLNKPSLGKGDYRYFSLVQWQKSGERAQSDSANNNNKSLLALNKCIYELYKYNCRHQNNQEQTKQLWANFRNSIITKMLKNYLLRQGMLWTLGCVSLNENHQNDSYHTLMLCKNISKLTTNSNLNQNVRYKFSSNQYQKLKTEPIHENSSKQQLNHLTKVKNNLKKILQEKRSMTRDSQAKSRLVLLNKESSKKIELQSIRLKKEEVQIREEYSIIKKASSNQASRISTKDNSDRLASSFVLPSIAKAKDQEGQKVKYRSIQNQEIHKLNELQMKKASELDQIHRELSLDKADIDIQNNSLLKAKIRLQQKQMMAYIEQKQKLIRLLRQQAKQVKSQDMSKSKYRGKSRMNTVAVSSNIKQSPQVQLNYQIQNIPSLEESRESIHNLNEKSKNQNQNPESAQKQDFMNNQLSKVNKNNYLFEKRRLELKFKLSKGRVDVNKFYEQAARRYQDYKPK